MRARGSCQAARRGFDDRGILQITLIASWFNYINPRRMRSAWAAIDTWGMVKRSLATILFLALAVALLGKTGIWGNAEASTISVPRCHAISHIHFVHNNGALEEIPAGNHGTGCGLH